MRKFLILLISLFIFTEIYSDITVTYPTSSTVWYHGEQETYVLWEGAVGPTVHVDLYKGGFFVDLYHGETNNDGNAGRTTPIFPNCGTGDDFQLKVVDTQGNYGFSEEFTINGNGSEIINVTHPTSTTIWSHGQVNTYSEWTGAEGDLVWLALYKSGVFLTNYVQWTENDGHADRIEEIYSSWGTGSDFQILIMDENANWGFSDEFTITSLDSEDNIVLVMSNKLIGNYPNPFNPETTIKYSINEDSNVQIEIYNIRGQKVKTLIDDFRDAGYHQLIWNGIDNRNKPVSSGLYFYRLKSNSFSQIRKMLLLK